MFEELAKEFDKIRQRSDKIQEALTKSKKTDTQEAIESVQAQLPVMKVSVDLQPMFDTPEEAKAASEDKELILIESFKKNLLDYLQGGI
jgi:hypothetical protein